MLQLRHFTWICLGPGSSRLDLTLWAACKHQQCWEIRIIQTFCEIDFDLKGNKNKKNWQCFSEKYLLRNFGSAFVDVLRRATLCPGLPNIRHLPTFFSRLPILMIQILPMVPNPWSQDVFARRLPEDSDQCAGILGVAASYLQVGNYCFCILVVSVGYKGSTMSNVKKIVKICCAIILIPVPFPAIFSM